MFLQFLTHAGIYIGLATLILGGLVLYNPRLMMQDYPPAIKDVLPPKTEQEKELSTWLGMPFLILLLVFPIYATFVFQAQSQGTAGFLQLALFGFGVTFAFNLWDWLVLDWLIFCTITPRWMIIAGSEGNPGYKDYAFHFRGFLIGTIFSLVMGLIAASIVVLAA